MNRGDISNYRLKLRIYPSQRAVSPLLSPFVIFSKKKESDKFCKLLRTFVLPHCCISKSLKEGIEFLSYFDLLWLKKESESHQTNDGDIDFLSYPIRPHEYITFMLLHLCLCNIYVYSTIPEKYILNL